VFALIRPVPGTIAACELTHLQRVPIVVEVARRQHAAYEAVLRSLGCDVRCLPVSDHHPDSVFIEDTATVLDEVAIIARPGAASRRGETAAVADAVAAYRPVRRLSAPATLDGGDVLRLDRVLFVGVGVRTNDAGVAQLAEFVRPFDYEVRQVRLDHCLHLKSAATEVAPGTVLVNPAWIDGRMFERHETIEVDSEEPFAANVLRIGSTIVCAAAHVRTNARLDDAGFDLRPIDVSELAKAEAGVTCCSLVFRGREDG
jgi:dimethylargininase